MAAGLFDLPAERITHAMFEAVMSWAPLSVAFWDAELRFVRINELAASLNGPTPAEHVGRTFRELVSDSVADAAEPTLREVLETGRPVTDVEIKGTWPAGGERFFLASFYPINTRAGERIGVGSLGIDVTDRKLFLDMKDRERRALEINDNVVQGLTVALMALEAEDYGKTEVALQATIGRARDIIGDLIGTASGNVVLSRGRLRRTTAGPRFLEAEK